MTEPKPPLEAFLNLTSLKEVSLLIAKDEREMREFRDALSEHGFTEAMTAGELARQAKAPSKAFIDLDAHFEKPVYEFLEQYPTGQIQLFDGEAMASSWTTPVYKDSVFVFLVSKERLATLEKEGFGIRQAAGPAYQS